MTGVIFDMDGVLIDAREWHFEALNKALSLFGFAISRVDHLSTYDGLPTRRKLELLSLERGLPVGLHSLISRLKQQYTMELIAERCRPTFQHEYCLAQLKARGFSVAVASNSIRQTIDAMMSASELKPYIDHIVSNEDVDEAKPAPDIYELALNRMQLESSEVLVVEDNDHGIAAAEAAGIRVAVVRSPEDLTWEWLMQELGSNRAHDKRVSP